MASNYNDLGSVWAGFTFVFFLVAIMFDSSYDSFYTDKSVLKQFRYVFYFLLAGCLIFFSLGAITKAREGEPTTTIQEETTDGNDEKLAS